MFVPDGFDRAGAVVGLTFDGDVGFRRGLRGKRGQFRVQRRSIRGRRFTSRGRQRRQPFRQLRFASFHVLRLRRDAASLHVLWRQE